MKLYRLLIIWWRFKYSWTESQMRFLAVFSLLWLLALGFVSAKFYFEHRCVQQWQEYYRLSHAKGDGL